MDEMRSRGYHVGKASQFMKFGAIAPRGHASGAVGQRGFQRDLFGFADIMAYKPGLVGMTAVQSTTKPQITAHLRKYREDDETRQRIRDFLLCSNVLLIHGWQRVEVPTKSKTAKSATKTVWTLTEHIVTLADMELKVK